MKKISRRNFIQLTGAATAAGAIGGYSSLVAGEAEAGTAAAVPAVLTRQAADLPRARGQRAVVVGGGWSVCSANITRQHSCAGLMA